MKISELIGLTILEIRFDYKYQNEYDMQEFFAYLKLSNRLIIQIPQYSDMELNECAELNKFFADANNPNKECRESIENQKITDVHFCFYDQEPDEERKAYLELENGIHFSEENFGPMGLTRVDLEILTKSNFEKMKNALEEDFEIKSYLTELKNVGLHQ